MASLRRNRTMPTDGAIAKFLYTILKQLDLKSIDWNEVAGSLDITNGHAARMRFSRFKQQMEGIPTQTRKPKASIPRPKKGRKDKVADSEKTSQDEDAPGVKPEPKDDPESMQGVEETVVQSPRIKAEPKEESFEGMSPQQVNTDTQGFGMMSLEPKIDFGLPVLGITNAAAATSELSRDPKEEPAVKSEPEVKAEPRWDE